MQGEAVIVSSHGGPQVLQSLPVRLEAPASDEVTIEQKAVGLNFIDIYFRTGLYQQALPHGLGFEASGIVRAVGTEVRHLRVGDRVVYGLGPLGAYASVRNMPARYVVRLPDAIGFEQAAALYMKGLTVQCLFRQTRRLVEGETILFHAAAGGVGLIACQWAKALGVRLIGTVSSPQKAALALQNGAWQVIDYSREDVVARVLELSDGKKVPVVYDGVGKDTWLTSLDCLAPRGLMVSFGNASGAVTGVSLADLAVRGSLYVTRPAIANYLETPEALAHASAEVFDMAVEGKLQVAIGQRFALADAAQAHEALAARQTTGATVLIPSS